MNLGDRLCQNHHAKIVERQINELLPRLELDDLYRGVGSAAYDPVVMLKMVIYQFLKGNHSPAKWCDEASLNQAMQWLGRGYQPGRRTWYDFRDRLGGCIQRIHQLIVTDAEQKGLLDPKIGVQDGTSVAACASRHRMVNQQTLQKKKQTLEDVIAGNIQDQATVPKWVPPTAAGREDLSRRMEVAQQVLSQRIRENAEKQKDRKDPDKIVVSLSDPDAPLGRDKLKVYRPMYTAQYVVAPHSQLIMAYRCDTKVTDHGTLLPMIDQVQSIFGKRFTTMIADSAYCSIVSLLGCQERQVDLIAPVQETYAGGSRKKSTTQAQIPREEFEFLADKNCYRCPAGQILMGVSDGSIKSREDSTQMLKRTRYFCSQTICQTCPLKDRCLGGAKRRSLCRIESSELLDRQREKMKQPETQKLYSLRAQTVEHCFGDNKENRGHHRLHGRGTSRAQSEIGLMVVAKNLFRLDKLLRNRATPGEDTS